MKEKKKHNRAIYISIILIILIIISAVIFNIYNDKKQENLLRTQIKTLGYDKQIDMNIQTKNEYANIEKKIKEDFQTLYLKSESLYNLFSNKDLLNIISVENYKIDGKTFTKSKELIQTTKIKAKTIFDELEYMKNTDNDNIFKDEKYKKLYISLRNDSIFNKSIDDIKNGYNKHFTNLQNIENTLNYLSENSNNWNIQDNKLTYTNDTFIDGYTKHINSILK